MPQGLYGRSRASALAAVDRKYHNDTLIVADLSNEPNYGEFLYQTFGPRVIGVHITRHGDGLNFARRLGQRRHAVYTLGRTQMIEQFHSLMASNMVRFVKGAESQRAYAQFTNLQCELRESGKVYSCLPGHQGDLMQHAGLGHEPSACAIMVHQRFRQSDCFAASSQVWLGRVHMNTPSGGWSTG